MSPCVGVKVRQGAGAELSLAALPPFKGQVRWGWAFPAGRRQGPRQVCSLVSETLSLAQISGTGSRRWTRVSSLLPQWEEDLQPAARSWLAFPGLRD